MTVSNIMAGFRKTDPTISKAKSMKPVDTNDNITTSNSQCQTRKKRCDNRVIKGLLGGKESAFQEAK